MGEEDEWECEERKLGKEGKQREEKERRQGDEDVKKGY